MPIALRSKTGTTPEENIVRYISPNQTHALEQFADSLELMNEKLELEIQALELKAKAESLKAEVESLRTGLFLVQDLNAIPFEWDRDKLYGGSSKN